ncbi:cytochrome C oxidase subunit IV family protein [Motiliproteus sp. MSK22-1]|uniref:cytochrome C oxidase subunit IV family protein n=1 Tax=Motiliproteus sp. MSK22-1 TaxID=1897630 RepID=UPI00097632C5|nr:cytochrome C oxidase subunit IV family protein [Motiliproteus sp. MSK22-1]OMH29468.1 hypothetical protein BGP75_19680 [Motiliproteus sp. MSK22-1]
MGINKNTETGRLTGCWLLLILLTLASAFIAESAEPDVSMVLLVSAAIICKGQLIIDRLMGLKKAPPLIRLIMLCYFYTLPSAIALALLFPEQLANLTTL